MQFRFFPAYFDRPTKMAFSEQEHDEIIELLLRQHWITNVPWIFYSILAAFVPFIVYSLRDAIGISFIGDAPFSLRFAILTLWLLVILAYMLESFLSWYFNIYIVTNLHLIDVDFHSILNREVREAHLQEIQSASSSIKGLFASFFNYGDVYVETASKDAVIGFMRIPYPDRVVDRINDLKEEHPEDPGV